MPRGLFEWMPRIVPSQPTRRGVLALAAVAAAHATQRGVKAIAFDAFTVFDPRPVNAAAEQLFPGKGGELAAAWRTRQFEYAWLRTITNTYADFRQVTEEALVYAAAMLQLKLNGENRGRLMRAFLQIPAWPDAAAQLTRLKEEGLRLALLSNFTEEMMDTGLRRSGLDGFFEARLSTDRVRAFKPYPRAYRMAIDTLHLEREQIAFAAFGGWDAAGAKAFGYATFWVNRLQLPAEQLAHAPDAQGPGLAELVAFVSGL